MTKKSKKKTKTPEKSNFSNPSSPSISPSESASTMADDSDFTVVSYDRNKKTRTRADEPVPVNTAKSAISNTTEVISKSPTNDVEMQTVNVWRFQEFQQHVMRLIHQLIDESSNKNHIFIQRWISATTGPKSINQDSSFRAV